MEVIEHKIPIGELTVGMYVSRLDRPWLDTPFSIQGFLIASQKDITDLEAYCRHVYVDVVKSRVPFVPNERQGLLSGGKSVPIAKYAYTPMEVKHGVYKEALSFDEESKSANQLNDDVNKTLIQITSQVSKGTVFDEKPVKNVASNIVSSVIRNPDVMACLTRVRESDDYLHHHSIRCSIWAALVGRHIGLRRIELEILTQSLLLKDLGKTRLPDKFVKIEENQLNSEERVIFKKHVAMTVKLVRQIPGINPKILPVIASHCERYDGSGYPRQLKGDAIPLLAIIAGLATYYDELTHPRNVNHSMSPSTALATLYDQRNSLFQEDVILEFIQALGLYPSGSIVELNTGELAVVVEQYAERRLRPRVVIVTNNQKQPVNDIQSLDLLSEALSPQEKELIVANGKKAKLPLVYIVRDLQQGEFPLDLLKVKEKLFIPNKKRFGFFSFRS